MLKSVCLGLFIALFCIDTVFAQQAQGVAKNQEIKLSAQEGMEWDSVAKTLTAHKKALAVRADTAIGADKMVAYYHELDNKKMDFYRVNAFGNVIVTTPKQTVYADEAVYEIEKSVIILKGSPVKLVTGEEQMTASVLELWRDQNMAVAKKDVVATKQDRRLEADTVKAYFAKKEGSKDQGLDIDYFEAENNVVITNDNEKVTADFGTYWVTKETADLEGNVRISQGVNSITGQVATINMKTGKSRLHSPEENGKAKSRVQGVFVPNKTDKKSKTKPMAPLNPSSVLQGQQAKNKESSVKNGNETYEKVLGESASNGQSGQE